MATDSLSPGRRGGGAALCQEKSKGELGSYELPRFNFDTDFLEGGWIKEMEERKERLLHGFEWRCLEICILACVSGFAYVG